MSSTAGAYAATVPKGSLRRRRRGAVISGLAVSNPPRAFTQDELLELFGLADDEFAEAIFARSGVRTRHLSATPASLRTSLQGRAAATEGQLFELARAALGRLELDPAEIGVLVTAGYWSLAGPTLGHRLMELLGLPRDTDKYHLTGVGCASAVPLLRFARQALGDRPGRRALVVAAESVSGFMTRARPGDPRTKVVGSALFGDGCGVALLDASTRRASGPEILATAVHQEPGTLDEVRFMVDDADSYMHLGRALPEIAERELPGLVDEFLAGQGLHPSAIDHWLLHPGGRGILEGAQRGLGLSDEEVAASASVLADYGNVGTAASFFVLKATEAMRRPAAGELGLMVSIGPGVTAGLMLLSW